MLRYVLILVLFIMIMAGVCWSAEEIADDKEVFTLDEMIVSATKTEERRGDISNSVILIDKDDIRSSTANGFGDMLGNENGIDLRTRGNYGGATQEIHIRGMGADGALVLVNGIVINSPSIGSANISGISLNGIKKIEVVKGSGSLLYGTGAMAGVINIITRRPEKDLVDLDLSAGYGSNSAYEIAAAQGMFITEDLGYYLTANRRATDGFRSNAGLDHKDISLKLIYDNEDLPDISIYGDYTDRVYGNPGVKTPSGTKDFIVNGIKLYDGESSNLLNEGGDKDIHLAFDINGAPLDRLRLKLKATYTDMESYNKNIYYFFTLSGNKTWVTNKVNGLEGNMDIDLFKGINLLVGAEYKRYKWENRGITLDENGVEISGTETETVAGLHTLGLLTEAQYRPNDHIKMIAGLRREKHSEFGIEYVPRYGIVISPSENTAIKLNYGRHYNAPTPNALFWPYEDWGWGMGTQGNRNLRPEIGKHSDAGMEQSLFNDNLFMNITYFRWNIEDKITWIPDASFFYTPQNLDRYKSHGWEIGLEARLLYNLTCSLAYTFADAEEEISGGVARKALYTSDSYFKSSIVYLNDVGFNTSATIRYTGGRPAYYALNNDTDPSITLDSYYTIDLKLEKDFLDKWIVALQCNNLFDKEYDTYIESFRDHESGIISMGVYPGEGRSFLFKVSYRYK